MRKFKRIGILYAMERESVYLRKVLKNVQVRQGTSDTYFKDFMTGQFSNEAGVAMCQCGIGKINSSIATFVMIQNFKPDIVINTGCCGGNVIKGVKPNDIILTSRAHFYDESDLNGETEFGKDVFYDCYPFKEYLSEFSPEVREKITIGPSATGDSFIETLNDVARIAGDFLSDNFPYSFDMEFSGVSRICARYNIPSMNARIVSDVPTGPDRENHMKMYEDFWESKDNVYELFLQELLKSLT